MKIRIHLRRDIRIQLRKLVLIYVVESLGMANILVVDDERDVVTLIKFLLEKDGHSVQSANNGAEALKCLGIEPPASLEELSVPALIILDVMMPIMNGTEVAKRFAEQPAIKDVPVIILSAKGQLDALFEESEQHIECLEKPFDPKKLRLLVDTLLKGGGA